MARCAEIGTAIHGQWECAVGLLLWKLVDWFLKVLNIELHRMKQQRELESYITQGKDKRLCMNP